MASFVHNDSGRLFREISPVGQIITVTPEIAGYLGKGVIFMREFGEKNITVVDKDELEREFTELSND